MVLVISARLANDRSTLDRRRGPISDRTAGTASRHAFGAVGTVPADADGLAVLLVHEFQHVKLGEVLELCDPSDPTTRIRLRVPWRPDPRPVEGVLQGTYAHLAIADIWRARSDAPAVEHFRKYRTWTARAVSRPTGADPGFMDRTLQPLPGQKRDHVPIPVAEFG
jgi:HEXXH motif-containing protein